MKSIHISGIYKIFIVVTVVSIFSASCDWGLDECAFAGCSDCQVLMEDCSCMNDIVRFSCPPGTVHGHYNYNDWFFEPLCTCVCDPGWMGTLCDQRDTAYYVRFRYGNDTLSLSDVITTSEIDKIDASELQCYYPNDNVVDTIILRSPLSLEPVSATSPDGRYTYSPICRTDSACYQLEVKLANGTIALADTGIIRLDSLLNATFYANLKISGSGQSFYIREGTIRLPYFFKK